MRYVTPISLARQEFTTYSAILYCDKTSNDDSRRRDGHWQVMDDHGIFKSAATNSRVQILARWELHALRNCVLSATHHGARSGERSVHRFQSRYPSHSFGKLLRLPR